MTYDFHGTWEMTTNFNSPLAPSPSDPAYAHKLTTQESIAAYIAGGVPREKIVVGVPFYGKGWKGVPSTNNGLYQPATGAAPGTWEAGTDDYKALKEKLASGSYTRYFDETARNAWLYDATNQIFWSFDDPKSLHEKAKFINKEELGGVMFWELSGDTADGELISTLGKFLK
jgi:chitinase